MRLSILVLSFFSIIFVFSLEKWPTNLELSTDEKKYLENGIIFHEKTKILLAEKFVNVEFLVPFPEFSLTLRDEIETTLAALQRMFDSSSFFCHLNFSSNFNQNDTGFNIDWLLVKVREEIAQAQAEVAKLRADTASFLNDDKDDQPSRHRRGALALAAVASIGLFGSGIALGGSGSCGLKGIFGMCQDRAKRNAKNIVKLGEYADSINEELHRFKSNTNEKFYMVSKELQSIKRVQEDIIATQNKNWAVVQNHFDVFEKQIHSLRDCDQLLFTRQQVNFNFDTLSSLLSLVFTNAKTYRSALYAYQLNIMNSIPSLLNGFLPMSLVPRDSLEMILTEVSAEQSLQRDRLTLAIPVTELLSYYEAKLLQDVVSIEEGILMTLSIPLASITTELTVYEAIPVPMPTPEQDQAIRWKVETKYLAVSEGLMETALLSQDQFDNCIGSATFKICHEAIPTEFNYVSCLATLYFKSSIEALQVCETERFYLPAREKAQNLGFGIWLITSAHTNFHLIESELEGGTSSLVQRHAGCNICLVTLACDRQIYNSNIRIRSDLTTCSKLPPIKLSVALPVPLQNLVDLIPQPDLMPYHDSKAEASETLFREVREEIIFNSAIVENENIAKIGQKYASKMTEFKPKLSKELDSYMPLKMSIGIGVGSFFVSILLHVGFMYAYHRFATFRKLVPNVLKVNKEKVHGTPVIGLTDDDYEKHKPSFENNTYKKKAYFIPHSLLDSVGESVVVAETDVDNENIEHKGQFGTYPTKELRKMSSDK